MLELSNEFCFIHQKNNAWIIELTAPWNRRILSNFQIWLNRSESFPKKNLLELEKNYLSPSKSQIFSQLFCVAHS